MQSHAEALSLEKQAEYFWEMFLNISSAWLGLQQGLWVGVDRHAFDLLNNVSYIWCNSKWKVVILADRFKKCLGEQLSCTSTDTTFSRFFSNQSSVILSSTVYLEILQILKENCKNFCFTVITGFLDLAKQVKLILLDFWLSHKAEGSCLCSAECLLLTLPKKKKQLLKRHLKIVVKTASP